MSQRLLFSVVFSAILALSPAQERPVDELLAPITLVTPTETDPAPDLEVLRTSAADGDTAAALALGKFLIRSAHDPVAMEEGIAALEQSLMAGSGEAAFTLAQMHAYGSGVPMDLEKGFRFYLRAAELDWKPAFSYVGTYLFNAWGCERDFERSYYWLDRSIVEAEDHQGMFIRAHAHLWDGEVEKARPLQVRAVLAGNHFALRALAGDRITAGPMEGIKDSDFQVRLREQSVRGDIECTRWLAMFLLRGIGSEARPRDAFLLMQGAAMAGDKTACRALARMHRDGIGTEPSAELFAFWAEKGSE